MVNMNVDEEVVLSLLGELTHFFGDLNIVLVDGSTNTDL
jgi:hypothetical protein